MTEIIVRKTLAETVADRIEARIREGRGWQRTLPGYRTLANLFGTSRKTCIAAMEILEVRRVVLPAKQGSRRQIALTVPTSDSSSADSTPILPERRQALLILSSSVTPTTGEDWYALRRYGDAWMRRGHGVNMAQVDYGRYRQPLTVLKSLVETHQAGAILIHLAPARWTHAAAELVPVYMMGGENVGGIYSGDYSSLQRDAMRILGDLRALGHERVLMPFEPHLTSFQDSMMGVLNDTFKRKLRPGLIEDLCPIFPESVPVVWQDYWERAFARTAPTAVILLKDAHLLSLYSYCAANRIDIPKDLSIIYIGYSDLLEWLHPAPTQMRFPLKRAMAHFGEWIRGGLRPIGMKVFELDLVPGGSIGPARKGHLPAKEHTHRAGQHRPS